MKHHFVIIGLGRLGCSMISTLDSLGHEVLGIDSDERIVQDLSERFPDAHFVAANATDQSILRDQNVTHFDGAAVVIGEDIGASILVTTNLKELMVPFVVSRALNKRHARVLEKVGADRVIEPEKDMGAQVARMMAVPGLIDYVEVGEDEALIEVQVPRAWVGKSLAELHLYRRSGLTVLALERKGSRGTIPSGDTVLQEGDMVVIGGAKDNLDKFLAASILYRA